MWENNYRSKNLPFYKTVQRETPKLSEAPEALLISYYNASFRVKYWSEAKIYVIMEEQLGAAPFNL